MSTQPTARQYLALANASYGPIGPKNPLPIGWTIIRSANDAATGFVAFAYQNNVTGAIVVAFGGTTSTPDGNSYSYQQLKADISLMSDDPNNQNTRIGQLASEALNFSTNVSATSGSNSVFVTGHSLGGYLAQYVMEKTQLSGGNDFAGGATFGAPGVVGMPDSYGQYGSASYNSNWHNYVNAGDVIGNYTPYQGDHYGNTVVLGNDLITWPGEWNARAAADIAQGGNVALSLAVAITSPFFAVGDHLIGTYSSNINALGVSGAVVGLNDFQKSNFMQASFNPAGTGGVLPPTGYDPIIGKAFIQFPDGTRLYLDPKPEAPSPSSIDFGQMAGLFGSTLGRLIGGSNLVIGTASGSIIAAAAMSFGKLVFDPQAFGSGYHPNPNGVGNGTVGVSSVWNDFQNNLNQYATNAAIGSVSSYLAGEFAQSIGLNGFTGQTFSLLTSNALQFELTSLVNGTGFVNVFSAAGSKAFGTSLQSGIASFVGTELATLVVTPHTVAESTLASLGSALGAGFGTAIDTLIGSTALSSSIATFFGFAGSAVPIVGTVIGAFIGFILGDLIGSLFGDDSVPRIPSASAQTILQIPLAQYAIGTETSANGGDLQLSGRMAAAARDTLNGIIGQVTGGNAPSFVSNTYSPTQIYGVNGQQIYVQLAGVTTNVSSGDQAVDKGVLWALPQTQIIGGDIFLKRAIQNDQAVSVTALLGDLQIASDYEKYLASRPIIDAAISSSWNSLSATDQAFYTANKAFMTRAISASQIALAGADVTFYNANKAQIDRIVGGISVSSFAAGWIVTLSRAAELGLGNFGRSDFFGGLAGFVQSFGVAATGTSVHYEDISLALNGADVTISANGGNGAGTFALLPQASADGSSVTLANFGATVGYVVQPIGSITGSNDLEVAPANGVPVTVSAGVSASSRGGKKYGYYGYYRPATNTGDDIIIGGSGADNLSAGVGNVWIDGGAGNDVIVGGSGRDVLLGGAGDDRITAGSGDTYLAGGVGNDTLVGGSGNDTFAGDGGSNTITGGTGSNTYIIGMHLDGGHDTINGVGTNNTLDYERFISGVNVTLSGGTQSLYGDTVSNIQNVIGTAFNDVLTAAPGGSYLYGGAGNDVLNGGAGNDILEGGAGADIINGGGGNNTISYAHSSAGVYINLATGTAIGGDATGDVFTNIQNITGSANADELAGDANINIIQAGGGDDWIDASVGADTYDGGSGFNTVDYSLTSFVSGTGTATGTYYGPYGTPYTYTYTTTIPAISVTMNAAGGGSVVYRNADGSSATQTLISIQQIIGTSSNDTLSDAGTSLDMTFDGGGGNDTYYGGSGSDTYIYASGYGVSTIYDSNAGSNTIKIKSGVTFDNLWVANSGGSLQIGVRGETGYVQAASDFATTGNDVIKTLDLAGAAQVDLTTINAVYAGSDGGDVISGSSATSNLILGYAGNDTIYAAGNVYSLLGSVIDGGAGNDTIYTSSGDDQFLFERGDGQDTIYDTGGNNKIIFGPTVGANDVIYQVVGNDLYVGIKDPNNPTYTASQVADNMRIVNGGIHYYGAGGSYNYTNFSIEAGGAWTDLNKANIAWTMVRTGPVNHRPIVLDLNNDGLELSSVYTSDIITKDAQGNVLRTGWVGPTNGILAVDRLGNGQINTTADISFVGDKAGATSDLGGLAGWDTNGDGVIDAKDANFSKLVVWVDKNQDGRAEAGEVFTLAQLGITSINLNGTPTGFTGNDTSGSFASATTTFTRSNGTIGTAYDVALASQFLNGPVTPSDASSLDPNAVGTFGQLKSYISPASLNGQTPSLAAQNAAAVVDISTKGGTISAQDAALWAAYLDTAQNTARKAANATGSFGSSNLPGVIQTPFDNSAILQYLNRGARDPKGREQVMVIDFNHNGPDLIDAKSSGVFVDTNHTGTPAQIGWVKPSDGILVYDRNGDGVINPATEISFLSDAPNANTNFQGLRAFDTNHDGVIDAKDASFNKFLIWRDFNGNGVSDKGELQTLTQAGIKSIQLTTSGLRAGRGAGSTNDVLGISSVTFTDGSTRGFYDVALGFADSKEPGQNGSAQTGQVMAAITKAASSQATANGVNPSTNAPSSVIGNTSGGVSMTRASLDGPSNATVDATLISTADAQWWRDASIVGQTLAGLSQPFAGNDNSLGSNTGTAAASGAVTDAAMLQRQALLRQSIASLQPNLGGSAAIWSRGTGTDNALALASSFTRGSSQGLASTGTCG